jgi:ectoine hydroxylase-related dioxygenase (phytanoyl-CoA dioxygenase family)
LEDISIDAGSLFYHIGSHNWHFEYLQKAQHDTAETNEPVSGDIIAARAKAWLDRLASRIVENGTPKKPMVLRRGDAVVWHARLAHGGMPRVVSELSRRSVVYHFIGKKSKLFTFEEFFTFSQEDLLMRDGLAVPTKVRGLIEYQSHPYFVTYDDGKEIVHQL